MRSVILSAIAAAGVLATAGGVEAGSIQINGLAGGSFTLQSTGMGNLFGGGSASFNSDALNLIHQELHSSGITTSGVVTIIAIDTGAGLSLVALTGDGDGTASGAGGFKWVSSSNGGTFVGSTPGALPHGGAADLVGGNASNAGSSPFGAGLGWVNLAGGDAGNFNFGQTVGDGTASASAYQFVTWNGSSWQVINTGTFSGGAQSSFGFNFTVVALPRAFLVGLAGLVAVAGVMFVLRRTAK